MALLPDATTAASERSPVKKRLCGESTCPFLSVLKDVHNMRALIRRGSGIKKAQIQNSQQNEFKRGRGIVEAHASPGKARSQELSPCCVIKRGPNWVGVGQGGPEVLGAFGAKKTRKNQKKTFWSCMARLLQLHPGFCAGGSSRTNGSGYPLSVPDPPRPPGRSPTLSNTPPKGRRI